MNDGLNFIWNGMYLGDLDHLTIESTTIGNIDFWTIHNKGTKISCIAKPTKTRDACILDEMKEFFGLAKLGTHTAKLKGKLKLLIRSHTSPSGSLAYDQRLDKINYNKDIIRSSVQMVMIYKDIMACSPITERNILIRNTDTNFSILCANDSFKIEKEGFLIGKAMIRKWFDDENPAHILRHHLNIRSEADVSKLLSEFKDELTSVIGDIDDTKIGYVNFLYKRLLTRL